MYAYPEPLQILSIPAHYLYDEWKIMSESKYRQDCVRGKLMKTKTAGGKGNNAYVAYASLPFEIKQRCIKEWGDPRKVAKRNLLEQFIEPDIEAARFFAAYRKPNGKALPQDIQIERVNNCQIMNAIKTVLETQSGKAFGTKTQQMWKNISNAVNTLDDEKWLFKLPGAWSRLRQRYSEYQNFSYSTFIHKNEGNQFAIKITDEIGDWLLAQYCLPIKYTVPELLEEYTKMRFRTNWVELSESEIKDFLHKPNNERIWTLARDGKEAYDRKYKHTLTRRRKDYFPNCYWAIDGTKLDMVYYDDNTSTKMNANLKIDVVFDIYSEKILGFSLSKTENHVDHFHAIRESVLCAGCRPFLFTYDQQSGHKMTRMQNFYTNLVAKTKGQKGVHYCHRSQQHNSPVEQLFNRLQSQVIKKFWFHDGQGVKVKTDQAKANFDFILEFKHKLPTDEELSKTFKAAVNMWNSSKHPKFEKETRDMVYRTHKQLKREELSLVEIVDQMWIEETGKPVTYKGHGLDLWVAGKKYQYEVYDDEGNIDLDFRQYNVGKKFVVRYDPDYMNTYIQLCEKDHNGNVVFVRNAAPKRQHQDVPILMQPGDKEQWHKDYKVRDKELERDTKALKALRKRTGVTEEKLIADTELLVKMGGRLPKDERNEVDNRKRALLQLT